MARVVRGDIVLAELYTTEGNEQRGRRPVVVVSQDVCNERSGTVIATALTSQEPHAGFPLTHELLGPKLPKRSWVKIGQIRTLSVLTLRQKIGHVQAEELQDSLRGWRRSSEPNAGAVSLRGVRGPSGLLRARGRVRLQYFAETLCDFQHNAKLDSGYSASVDVIAIYARSAPQRRIHSHLSDLR